MSQIQPVLEQEAVLLTLLKGFLELLAELLRIDAQLLECLSLAGLEFGYDGALIADELHVVPPLFGMQFEEQLFPDLLVEDEPSVGRLGLQVMEGAVGVFLVAVGRGTVLALGRRVDQVQIHLLPHLGVQLAEVLDEAIGVVVVL